ncbi:MAG: class II glutamine amidotransferase [Sandaracinaceae bacterium]|nr:class II glutamine amidotransferase [Sandaracinaceae bacterium]
MSSQLLAISFDSAASPSFTLKAGRPGAKPAAGWGFAWYPMDDGAAVVIKDPNATHETPLTRTLRDWDRFRSCVFLCHTHGAAKRVTQQDTHPFQRSYAGRDWVFAHSGDLDRRLASALPITDPSFEPLGTTDSEHAFCWLLSKVREVGARSLADLGWETLHGWMRELNAFGTASFLLSDGRDVVAYADQAGKRHFHRIRRTPPHATTLLDGERIRLDLGDPYDINRTMAIIAQHPLSKEEGWEPLAHGEMIVARRGVFTWASHHAPGAADGAVSVKAAEGPLFTATVTGGAPAARLEAGPPAAAEVQAREARPARVLDDEEVLREGRVLSVEHETIYRYEEPVERSHHVFRLHPVHDSRQDVLDYQLEISPPGAGRRAEDVFGNQILAFRLDRPYQELWIRATSRVRIRPERVPEPFVRSRIPLVWMPWQRQMMMPYLLPHELPETQLRALSEYAQSFVERNDGDLIETMDDLNQSIHRDYAYVPGATMLETSPFTVFVRREGVCQDFANLFICLAQLLNVPARYRVGYIYTGADYANQIQSEASHAWAEVYLPNVGWRGYDPTNGVHANLDHVRVAHGRNYREATPTSGTLFKGGAGEKLETSVKVELA